jgi:hypothetical protein
MKKLALLSFLGLSASLSFGTCSGTYTVNQLQATANQNATVAVPSVSGCYVVITNIIATNVVSSGNEVPSQVEICTDNTCSTILWEAYNWSATSPGLDRVSPGPIWIPSSLSSGLYATTGLACTGTCSDTVNADITVTYVVSASQH